MLATATALALKWAGIFVADLLRYLIGAGGVVLSLALLGRRADRRRIQQRRATPADRFREIGLSIQTAAIFALNGLVVFLLDRAGAISISPEAPGLVVGAAELAAIVLAHDAWFYWTHRALHSRLLFPRAHVAHHHSRTPTAWAAYAFAPAEAVLQAIFLPLFLLCLPMHGIILFLFLAHMILRNALGHSGHELMPAGFTRHWLGRWFTTSVHHDLHHSEGRHNFGLYFTWWDRLLGTEHPDYHARFDAVVPPRATPRRPLMRTILPFMLVGGLALGGVDQARAEGVEGLWLTEEMDAVIEIESASDSLSGRIRWRRDHAEWHAGDGSQQFSRFSAGSDRWVGRIQDREGGRSYRASIRPRGRNWLEVRQCRNLVCEVRMWRRLGSYPASGTEARHQSGQRGDARQVKGWRLRQTQPALPWFPGSAGPLSFMAGTSLAMS